MAPFNKNIKLKSKANPATINLSMTLRSPLCILFARYANLVTKSVTKSTLLSTIISKICKKFDEMIVDRSVDFVALLVTKFAYLANKMQSGDLSVMLRFMVAGFALLLSFIFLLNGAK